MNWHIYFSVSKFKIDTYKIILNSHWFCDFDNIIQMCFKLFYVVKLFYVLCSYSTLKMFDNIPNSWICENISCIKLTIIHIIHIDICADPGGGVDDPPPFWRRGAEEYLLTPLFLETSLKVCCNLFSCRYKTNFLVKSAFSHREERIFNF